MIATYHPTANKIKRKIRNDNDNKGREIVMKKFVPLLSLCFYFIITMPFAYAADQCLAFLPAQQEYYYLHDALVKTDENQPWESICYEGHTYLPVRAISELFGFQVAWQPETQTVQLSDNEKIIALTVGMHSATVNQQATNIDYVPILQNGRCLIPIRTLAHLTGAAVLYEDGVIYYSESPITDEQKQTEAFQKIRFALLASNTQSAEITINTNQEDNTVGIYRNVKYYLSYYDSEYDALYSYNLVTGQTQLLEPRFIDRKMNEQREAILRSIMFFHHQEKDYLAIQRGSVNLGNYELFEIAPDSLQFVGWMPHAFSIQFFANDTMYYTATGTVGGEMLGLFYRSLTKPDSDEHVMATSLMIHSAYCEDGAAYLLAEQRLQSEEPVAAKWDAPQIYRLNLASGEYELFLQIK